MFSKELLFFKLHIEEGEMGFPFFKRMNTYLSLSNLDFFISSCSKFLKKFLIYLL